MKLSLNESTRTPKVNPVSVVVGGARLSMVPSLDSCASTISKEGRSDSITEGLNSTTQFTVTVEPLRIISLPVLVETVTDKGGTIETEHESM